MVHVVPAAPLPMEPCCREILLAKQLFLLQTSDVPGNKSAVKEALLADVTSNGTHTCHACLYSRSALSALAPRPLPQISRRSMCTAANAWAGAWMQARWRLCKRAMRKPSKSWRTGARARRSPGVAPGVAALANAFHLACVASVTDAVANLGESEVREALLAKAVHFVKIGDKARSRTCDGAGSHARAACELTMRRGVHRLPLRRRLQRRSPRCAAAAPRSRQREPRTKLTLLRRTNTAPRRRRLRLVRRWTWYSACCASTSCLATTPPSSATYARRAGGARRARVAHAAR